VHTTQLFTLHDFPLVEPGENLTELVITCLDNNQLALEDGDVLVLAQKVISKAENRYIDLATVSPSEEAKALALKADKDPRQMQVLLDESKEVVKVKPGVVIVEHNKGYVHANAGIDQSNISTEEKELLLLLPEDSDQSAAKLRNEIKAKTGKDIFVVINDSFGRAWRNGTCGVCIGSAGFEVIDDRIGEKDLFGQELKVTQIAIADEIAAAASMIMGQTDEGTPVVVVRGLTLKPSEEGSSPLIRAKQDDLFR